MKAIITNQHSERFGLTFEVKSIGFEKVITDNNLWWGYKDCLPVDIDKEMQLAYDNANWDSSLIANYTYLKEWAKANNIKYKEPTYNAAY